MPTTLLASSRVHRSSTAIALRRHRARTRAHLAPRAVRVRTSPPHPRSVVVNTGADAVEAEIVPDGPRGGTGVALPPEPWTSPNWNWGSARGDAHDAARVVRGVLNESPSRRRDWITAMVQSTPSDDAVPWEEVKLVMALAFQLSGHRRAEVCRSGNGTWLEVMAMMQRGYFEGGMTGRDGGGGGDLALAMELEARLTPDGKNLLRDAKAAASASGAPAAWVHDAVRRSAAMAVLLELQFLEVGI